METTKQNTQLTKAKDVENRIFESFSTTYDLIDEWWSFQGGILKGRVIYLTGSSGAGKTTFLTQLQSRLKSKKTGQYNCESPVSLVKSRNSKFDYHDNMFLDDAASVMTLEKYFKFAEEANLDLAIVDSLTASSQTIDEANAELIAAKMAMEWSQKTGGTVILIGMVTKEDVFAGSNKIMHYVDAHIHMQFDKEVNERYMYFDQKNRDGALHKKIFYQFREDGKGIEFFSEEEWLVRKRGVKMHELVQKTMQAFISGWKNHPNYNKFRNELSDAQNQLVKQGGFSNQTAFQAAIMVACNDLIDKHFS